MSGIFPYTAFVQSRSVLIGELCLLMTGVFEGLYPVLIVAGSAFLPPITFLALGALVAIAGVSLTLLLRRKAIAPVPPRAVLLAAGVALFVLSGFLIILIATPYTSSVNIGLLLRAELLSAFFISILFLGERPTPLQVSGALLILTGTLLVLFRGGIAFHIADLCIVLAACIFPLGNICAKRALDLVLPETLLLLRYGIGAVVLVPAAFLFEDPQAVVTHLSAQQIMLVLLYGIAVLTLSKIFWYVGLRVVPLGKATFLGDTAPAFTMLFAFLFLGETSGIAQWTGLLLMFAGVYALIKRPSASVKLADLV